MLTADPSCVSLRAKKRGLPQFGTLGAGNHYCEVQVVDEIYDIPSAARMGVTKVGQIVVFIHSGSRGLGHQVKKSFDSYLYVQVASDAIRDMERAMKRDNIKLNDRQLACARITSPEVIIAYQLAFTLKGQNYLKAMAAAANFAWVNRQSMTFLVRQAFARIFQKSPLELDMHVIYDVVRTLQTDQLTISHIILQKLSSTW